MTDEITLLQDNVASYLEKLSRQDFRKSNNIVSEWQKILGRINSKVNPYEGQNLAAHSRIIDIKNGIVLVEADHPGWIQLLKIHQNYILKGLQIKFPELKIRNIVYRLKGNKAEIFDTSSVEEQNLKTRKQIEKRIEEQEEINKNLNFSSVKNSKKAELPQELASIFKEMENDMLTNQKN